MADAIRPLYDRFGPERFYQTQSQNYVNPHEATIHTGLTTVLGQWWELLTAKSALDLACGSGEVTRCLGALGWPRIDGIDPYLAELYEQRTGRPCARVTFADIAQGLWQPSIIYNVIFCSFALHLVEKSYLPTLCQFLSSCAERFIVITPHKRPTIKAAWGWCLLQEELLERVRFRLYLSTSDRATTTAPQ